MDPTSFYQSISGVTGDRREALILAALQDVVPAWCRVPFKASDKAGHAHDVVLSVAADYLGVGDGTGFFRLPMCPRTARNAADHLGAVLPTREMVERVYAYGSVTAGVVLRPHTITQKFFRDNKKSMTSSWAFKTHNDLIEAEYTLTSPGRDRLLVGHKKDIVVTPRLTKHKVAIFGWYSHGKPIQDLNYMSHSDGYVDYSHGVRLVRQTCEVDGVEMRVADVLASPTKASWTTGRCTGRGLQRFPQLVVHVHAHVACGQGLNREADTNGTGADVHRCRGYGAPVLKGQLNPGGRRDPGVRYQDGAARARGSHP